MWLGVLGPVQCAVEGTAVEVKGRLNRALLAALTVDSRRVTGVDELVDALWGDDPPPAAEKVVRNRVSMLRRALTGAFIETVGAGYRLGTFVDVDVRRFEDAATSGAERLALWRGAPFEDIARWPPAQAASVRLGEVRAYLDEVAIAEQLDAGTDASALVGGVESLVEAAPFRERRWALLMRTLYLAGRQHDALRAFQRARNLLRDELGLSPGAELLAVERAILNHEPSLGPRASSLTSARAPRTSTLVGRDQEAAAIRDLLQSSRLVTLSGLGGVGKTSLATEVSAAWGEHRMVDLRAVDDPHDVDDAVVRSLRIAAGNDPGAAIVNWASSADRCLLVLDNCEHVRNAAVAVADAVLHSGDGPTVLTTSRIPLGHRAETVFRVEPLARVDAVTLFRVRAMHRRTPAVDDHDVDRLCGALSDLPLAIELAAAHSSVLSPADMIRDLTAVTNSPRETSSTVERRAEVGGGVIDVVAWAVEKLSPDALLLFRRCAVFPGGFTMEAARAMVAAELDRNRVTEAFGELAEASLIEVRFQPGTRYHYLELVRQRADALLDSAGDRRLCEQRMTRWAVTATDRITYLHLPDLLAELPNLVAAANHACTHRDVDAALRITGASFVLVLAQRGELIDAKRAAVELAGAEHHERFGRSCAELAHAYFVLRGDLVEARRLAETVLAAEPEGRSAGWALHTLGHIEGDLGHVRRALQIARRWHDPLLTMYASSVIIDNAGQGGAPDAFELVADNDRIASKIGESWARIMTTLVRGMAYCRLDPDAALIHLDRAAEMADRCGLTIYATVARALAGVAGGDDPRARLAMTRRAILDAHRAGVAYMLTLALAGVARTLTEIGWPDRSATFAGAAYAKFWTTGDTGTRIYQIDRDDHQEHLAMYDLGATMDVNELVALIDEWLSEEAPDNRTP